MISLREALINEGFVIKDVDIAGFTLENMCQNPEHELFMYALLMGRFEMAKFFLREGKV
jgi:hypothetical protein